jgi:hypothetical protein
MSKQQQQQKKKSKQAKPKERGSNNAAASSSNAGSVNGGKGRGKMVMIEKTAQRSVLFWFIFDVLSETNVTSHLSLTLLYLSQSYIKLQL